MAPRTNWAGSITYRARSLRSPRSVDELAAIIRASSRLRALGSGHSFNRIADTDRDQVTVASLPRRTELDVDAGTVTVDGGQRYGELCASLHRAGYALHNLASLAHISIAGGCATGTHGSGQRNGMLATALTAVELVDGIGTVRRFEPTDRAFPAVVTSLGALGVVTALTLRVEPPFGVAQRVYENLPMHVAIDRFDEILGSAHSVSMFTEWQGPVVDKVWRKARIGVDDDAPPPALRRARVATAERHPISGLPPEDCTPQRGVPGPWHERLPHFRLDHTPSVGDELQSEYFVSREDGAAALAALTSLRDGLAGLAHVMEIRTVARDAIWLSPAYGRDSVAFHFTWRSLPQDVDAMLRRIDDVLEPFAPRPHWGKLFTLPPDSIRARYPELSRFVEVAHELDPEGRFRNDYLDRYLFAGA